MVVDLGLIEFHIGHSTVIVVLLGHMGIWQNRRSKMVELGNQSKLNLGTRAPGSPCIGHRIVFNFLNPECALLTRASRRLPPRHADSHNHGHQNPEERHADAGFRHCVREGGSQFPNQQIKVDRITKSVPALQRQLDLSGNSGAQEGRAHRSGAANDFAIIAHRPKF